MCQCAAIVCAFLVILSVAYCAYILLAPDPLPPPGEGKSGYKEFESRQFFGLAAASYNDPHSRSTRNCIKNSLPEDEEWYVHSNLHWKCDSLGHPCQYLVAVSNKSKQIGIAFRGTNLISQLGTQIAAAWNGILDDNLPWTDGEINSYYSLAMDRLWHNKLWMDLLKNPDYENFTITFTGHSLGGALATIAAVRTVSEGIRLPDQVQLFTFGAPRVGNYKFIKEQEQKIKKSFRIVNQKDIVTHVPPCLPKDSSTLDNVCEIFTIRGQNCTIDTAYYHGNVEIWYPKGMPDIDDFMEANFTKWSQWQEQDDAKEGAMEKIASGNESSLESASNEQLFYDPNLFFTECWDEDTDCSNAVIVGKYIAAYDQHFYYFHHHVSDFGQKGCKSGEEMEEAKKAKEDAREVKKQVDNEMKSRRRR